MLLSPLSALGTLFLCLVALSSLAVRAFALSYGILFCDAWLLSLGGLLFF